MPRLSITLDEGWAAHRYCRQTDKLGMEHDKEQQLRLHAALAWLKENPAGTYDLDADLEYLWWLDRSVPDLLTVGSTPVGRNLLLKVQAAIAAAAVVPEDHEDDAPGTAAVPAVWAEGCQRDDAVKAAFEAWLESQKEGG